MITVHRLKLQTPWKEFLRWSSDPFCMRTQNLCAAVSLDSISMVIIVNTFIMDATPRGAGIHRTPSWKACVQGCPEPLALSAVGLCLTQNQSPRLRWFGKLFPTAGNSWLHMGCDLISTALDCGFVLNAAVAAEAALCPCWGAGCLAVPRPGWIPFRPESSWYSCQGGNGGLCCGPSLVWPPGCSTVWRLTDTGSL